MPDLGENYERNFATKKLLPDLLSFSLLIYPLVDFRISVAWSPGIVFNAGCLIVFSVFDVPLRFLQRCHHSSSEFNTHNGISHSMMSPDRDIPNRLRSRRISSAANRNRRREKLGSLRNS